MHPQPFPDGATIRSVARIPALDVLRIVAVLGVVSIHVFAAVVLNDEIRGSGTWWTAVALDLGFVWVVPAFVMVSGALVLDPRMHERGPAHFYRKRALRLGPAVLFWPLFYIVVVSAGMSGQQLSAGSVAAKLLEGEPYTHLYFLWLICGLYAVAPVLASFLSQGTRVRAVIFAAVVLGATVAAYAAAGLLAYGGVSQPIYLNALTQWIPYVGYFLAGWALRDLVLTPRMRTLALAGAAGAVTLVVWMYGTRPANPLLHAAMPVSYLGFAVAVATVCIFMFVRSGLASWAPGPRTAKVIRTLSDATFGVFLLHFAVIIAIRVAFPSMVQPAASSILVAGGVWLVVVGISFAVTILARRVPILRQLF